MRKLLLLLVFLISGVATVRAQQPLGVPALDQLVTAFNAKSVAPLQSYLTPETRVGTLPAAYTGQVLAQVFAQGTSVESSRLVSQTPEGANTRYVCAFTRKGNPVPKEFDALLSPEGKFLELNLVKAEAKRIDTRFGPQDLTTPPSIEVPLRLVHGLIIVEAEVNGRRGAFVLDSGAPSLVLNQREFAAPSGQATLAVGGPQGVNGTVGGASYCAVQRFDWAGIGFQNKETLTLDLASIEQHLGGTVLLGLIGQNLLSQYALTLDYRAGRVQLRKPGTAETAETAETTDGPPLLRLPFTLRGHLPVVEATTGGQPFQMGLDCAAQTNLLGPQYEPLLATRLRRRKKVKLRGAGKDVRSVVSGRIPELQLAGGLPFRQQQTVFSDISHLNKSPDKTPIQGLLGYPFLSQYRTTIDYVNKELRFYKW